MPLGTSLLLGFLWLARGIEVYNTEGQVHYWLQRDDLNTRPFLQVPLFVAAVTVFVLASIPFIALGQNLRAAHGRESATACLFMGHTWESPRDSRVRG